VILARNIPDLYGSHFSPNSSEILQWNRPPSFSRVFSFTFAHLFPDDGGLNSRCRSLVLWRENVVQITTEPVHDLLEGFEGDALLAILQSKEAWGRDSELSGERSIRDFTPPFTEEDRKLMVQRLPHGETVNKSLFLLRNFLLAEFHKGNTVVAISVLATQAWKRAQH
jgi:hypothetical protein